MKSPNKPKILKEYTKYKLELKPAILEEAGRQFTTYGIRSVKMDDIAKALSISKRTMYELYDGKEALLIDVVKAHEVRRRAAYEELSSSTDNCIDILIGILTHQLQIATQVSTAFFTDLKQYPAVAEMIRCGHAEQYGKAMEFFRRGISEGYFISFVDYDLFNQIISKTMDIVYSDERFENLTFQELFLGYLCVVVRGFCTPKGLERIDAFIKEAKFSE